MTVNLLPSPSFLPALPVTIIVWSDGGRSERLGHVSPEGLRPGVSPVSVTYTDTDTTHAAPGVLSYPAGGIVPSDKKEPEVDGVYFVGSIN